MVRLVFTDAAGIHRVVAANAGASVMETAVRSGVREVVGECGGKLVCGTCHVFVASGPWTDPADMDDEEDDLLEYTVTPRGKGSRLSCQLIVTEESDGTVLRLPRAQTL